MHDEPNRLTPAQEMDQAEYVVLRLMLDDEIPGLWTVRELAQAVGSELKAADALAGLHAAGLVHRFDEFVCPTRSAGRAARLADLL